jgi:ketosteroid isomerase-like protein
MSVEENKNIARLYHELRPEDVDNILTPDFIGHSNPGTGFDWDRETHKRYWSQDDTQGLRDIVHELVAEGEFVAMRFARKGAYQGRDMQAEAMQLMRFEDGRIAEIWEYADPKQWEE